MHLTLDELDSRKLALTAALERAELGIAPYLGEVRLRLFELEEVLRPPLRTKARFEQIIEVVAATSGVDRPEIYQRSKRKLVQRARMAVVWVARQATPYTFPQIGRLLDGRDHTTILSAFNNAETARDADPDFRDYTDRILKSFTSPKEPPQCQLPI